MGGFVHVVISRGLLTETVSRLGRPRRQSQMSPVPAGVPDAAGYADSCRIHDSFPQ
jgi:hypothetical protein